MLSPKYGLELFDDPSHRPVDDLLGVSVEGTLIDVGREPEYPALPQWPVQPHSDAKPRLPKVALYLYQSGMERARFLPRYLFAKPSRLETSVKLLPQSQVPSV